MRCFIGFFVPEAAKAGILTVQGRMRRLPMDAKFVEPENLHVSLSFLGDVDDAGVADVEAKLRTAASERNAFRLVADRIKLVPNENYVRVIVLGVRDASGELDKLADGVKRIIGGDVKPPHLTLCRVKGVSDKHAVASGANEIRFDEIAFDVNNVALIESKLGMDGPTYSVVKSFDLGE